MTTRTHAWLAGLLVVAACARLYEIDIDLPLLFEEATPMRVAEAMWKPGGGLDPNPHFFNYPSLVIYANLAAQAVVMAAGVALGHHHGVSDTLAAWASDPTPIALAGRLVSVAAAVLGVFAVYRLGRLVAGAGVGLSAAAVLALSPWHISVSRAMLVDVPLLAFVALALTESVALCRAPTARTAILAGVFVGLAASAKYPGALTAAAIVAGVLVGTRASGRRTLAALAAAPLWLAGVAAVLTFLLTSPFVLLDAPAFAADLGVERLHMSAGHFGLDPGGALRAYALAIWNLLGGWGVPFLAGGIAVALGSSGRRAGFVPLAVQGVLVVSVLSSWSMYGAHYLAPVVPVLVVFCGFGIVRAGERLRRSTGRRVTVGAAAALALLALFVAGSALARYTRPHTRALAREWLLAHVAPGESIAYEHRSVDILDDPVLGARASGVRIPMNTIEPERATPFYDAEWYRGFDYLVVSGHVAARYAEEPLRFPDQAAFYDSLRARWVLAAAFEPRNRRGPEVTIYTWAGEGPGDAPLPPALLSRVTEAGPRVGARFLAEAGDAYLSRGWIRRAEGAYRRSLDLSPDQEPVLYNLGIALLAGGRVETAIDVLERARALDPTRAETHNNLGIARLRSGDRAGAREAFRAALEVSPTHETARQNLARLMEEDAGDARGARTTGTEEAAASFWLTLLHNNDAESKLLDAGPGEQNVGGISRFASVLERLRTEFDDARTADRGLVVVSSGDNYLAGPELTAGLEREGPPFDALAMDRIGYDALAIGNHEFDFGPDLFADVVDALTTLGNGHSPPFVSANLGFDAHPRLRASRAAGRIAPSTIIEAGGRRIGIVGATTPQLPSISFPVEVTVDADVAGVVQAEVDALGARGVGVIVLISHLQDVSRDIALVRELRDVDIVVAGGGDEVLANPPDLLVPGDEAMVAGPYPLPVVDSVGDTVRVVTTSGQYRYVGRLTVGFDDAGHVVRTEPETTGPVRVVAARDFPDGVEREPRIVALIDQPLRAALEGLGSKIVGRSEVALDGRRPHVRTRPTNLGLLVADAMLWAARVVAAERGLPVPAIAVHNGGGIRNDTLVPPGRLSELDTFRIVPFANFVTIVDSVSAERLHALLENAVSVLPGESGRYPQISGFHIDVDAARAGSRVRQVVLDDGTVVVADGVPVAGVRVVMAATDFLCRGGDEYPLADRPAVSTGVTVQSALARYVREPLGGVIEGDIYAPLVEGQ